MKISRLFLLRAEELAPPMERWAFDRPGPGYDSTYTSGRADSSET
jgi:hypothetical protein